MAPFPGWTHLYGWPVATPSSRYLFQLDLYHKESYWTQCYWADNPLQPAQRFSAPLHHQCYLCWWLEWPHLQPHFIAQMQQQRTKNIQQKDPWNAHSSYSTISLLQPSGEFLTSKAQDMPDCQNSPTLAAWNAWSRLSRPLSGSWSMCSTSSIKVQGGLWGIFVCRLLFLLCTHSVLYRRVYGLLGNVPVGINVPGINVNFSFYSKQCLVEEQFWH